jgi:hypothetical protein
MFDALSEVQITELSEIGYTLVHSHVETRACLHHFTKFKRRSLGP